MPANSTGLGCLVASILTMIGLLFLGHTLSQILASDIPQYIAWASVGAGLIAFLRFANKHS